MELTDVLRLLSALESAQMRPWLDGGWGVDCLLGEQTRPHGDLDLVVPGDDLGRISALLRSQGFSVVRDWLPTSLAFRAEDGREVDLHPIQVTTDGGGDQLLPDGSTWHYASPVDGSLGGRTVRCASAADQLAMHEGYEPRPVDRLDVARLVERFGLPWPAAYEPS